MLEPMQDLPRTIGPYKILGALGRGGMGVVYRGEHGGSGQAAAVKTVRAPSEELLSSIRREIHTLARATHPGIVRILDEGVEDALPWYAMELIQGVPLRRWASRTAAKSTATLEAAEDLSWWTRSLEAAGAGPASLEARPTAPLHEVLTLVRRLCAPLGFLHGEGMVHRDLKPENVLVRPDGWPVLVDFGLAAQFGGPVSREALEVSGRIAGTALYMAPEQARGELVDARADLYALGCILYELLTGRPPFVGRSTAQVLRQQLEAPPVPPSRLAEGLPEELDGLVLRLLAKQPRQRPGHADDVAAALARLGAEDGLATMGPQPRPYLYRPGLAGRDAALQQLDAALERLDEGRGGLLLIGGESGVGKTRLLLELSLRAERRDVRVLAGQSTERGGHPLEPLRRPLQRVADRCRERGPEAVEQLLGRHAKLLAQYEPALATLPGLEAVPLPPELSADAARLRLFGALMQTFGALAEEAPLLLLLDDLQWVDDLTAGFLEYLLRAGGEAWQVPRVLVVGTYRTEEIEVTRASLLHGLLDAPQVARIGLGRLGEAEVGAIAGDMLALEAAAPRDLSGYLARRSEGNPFFVAEYLRAAVAAGLLWRDAQGRWQVAEPAETRATARDYDALPLPHSLQELVGRRLQDLSEAARGLLDAAAVLGRETGLGLLGRILSDPEPQLFDASAELLRRQVLEEAGPGDLRFVHDTIRKVAYERIGPAQRSSLHRSAAEALEALPDQEARLAELAHHWEQAGELLLARERALAAARRARRCFAYGEAERLYRTHLRLTPRPTPESIQARNELGWDVLSVQGRGRDALPELLLALEEARGLGDRPSTAVSLSSLGKLYWTIGRNEEATAAFERALELARELGDRQLEGNVLDSLGVLHTHRGQVKKARQLFEQALDIARAQGDRQLEAQTLANLAVVDCYEGRLSEARALSQQGLSIVQAIGDRIWEGYTLDNLGVIDFRAGQLEPAHVQFEQAVAIARQVGDRRLEGIGVGHLAMVRVEQGSLASALELFNQALAIICEVGDRRFEGVWRSTQAIVERRLGRFSDARRSLTRAEALLRETSHLHDLILAVCEIGHLELAEGRSCRAELEKARALAAAFQDRPQSEIEKNLARLERAEALFAAGQPGRLLWGECVEDLPEALRPPGRQGPRPEGARAGA
jgi:tetratricopeptide (TPR) repeat protein